MNDIEDAWKKARDVDGLYGDEVPFGLPPLPKVGAGLKTLDDLFAVPDPKWNVAGIFQQNTIASVWGMPGAGKTTLLISMAGHLASGRPWCEREVSQGLVVFLPLEDISGLRARFAAWLQDNPEARPMLRKHLRWHDGLQDYGDLPNLTDKLKAFEQEAGAPIRLVVLDPILAAFGAEFSASDEKDFRDRLGKFQDLMQAIPTATGVSVTHCGWSGEHELGSIVQRALTATSVKVSKTEAQVRVDIKRQKNAPDGWGLNFQMVIRDNLARLSFSAESQTKTTKRATLADEALDIIRNLCTNSASGDVLESTAREQFLDAQPAGKSPETVVRNWRRSVQDLKAKKLITVKQGRLKATSWKG